MDARAYWDKKHTAYTTTGWIDKPSLFAEWARQYFPKHGRLLELGAGQAQDSRYFTNQGLTVTATDFSLTALELAQQKSPKSIEFKQVDLSQPLPFKADSFDVVYAHLSLHYFDQPATERLFAEIHRVLSPGGILAALGNSTDDPEMYEGQAIEPSFREIEGILKRFFSPDSIRSFAKDFKVLVADNLGTTYKDEAIGVHYLIRLICQK